MSTAAPAGRPLRVALVYPPAGPCGLPSLGLGLLSAGVRRRGFECRTFYFNFDLIDHMPGSSTRARYEHYHALTGRAWFPFNEWLFSRALYGDPSEQHHHQALSALSELAQSMPPGGLRYEEMIELHEHAPELIARMAAALAEFDVVGISSTFCQNVAALALARRLRERHPRQLVVLGGANCDGEMGVALLEQFGFVQAVFSGEVDHGFPELIERLSRGEGLEGIDGLSWRGPGGELHTGAPAHPLSDLDGLPYPDFDDYMRGRSRAGLDGIFEATLALESSRGCWWGARSHCTFCGLNANGMAHRQKSHERFIDEVEAVTGKYGAEFLFMTDNILSTGYYEKFAAWARERQLRIQYFYEIKANLKREHVRELAAGGVTAVQPGIESFSSPTLRLMRKGTTASQNIAFLKYAREYGVLAVYNILTGFPGEDPVEYLQMALELPKLAHLQPPASLPEVEFHRFSPYHQAPADFGLSLRPLEGYRHIYPDVPEEALARIAYMFRRSDALQQDRRHVQPLIDGVVAWRMAYREECSLIWASDGDDVQILDERPGFPRRRHRLRRYAALLFRELDTPQSLSMLREHARQQAEHEDAAIVQRLLGRGAPARATEPSADEGVMDFSAHSFLEAPERCLRPLIDASLLYVEALPQAASRRLALLGSADGNAAGDGRRYLALPVHAAHRPLPLHWRSLGV